VVGGGYRVYARNVYGSHQVRKCDVLRRKWMVPGSCQRRDDYCHERRYAPLRLLASGNPSSKRRRASGIHALGTLADARSRRDECGGPPMWRSRHARVLAPLGCTPMPLTLDERSRCCARFRRALMPSSVSPRRSSLQSPWNNLSARDQTVPGGHAGAVLGAQPDSRGSRLRVCSASGLEERKPFQAQ
jgi:hypothetical protein